MDVDFNGLDFEGVSTTEIMTEVKRAIHDALQAACDGDWDTVAMALRKLSDSGDGAVFLACVTWARVFCQWSPAARRIREAGHERATLSFTDGEGAPIDDPDAVAPARSVWVGRVLTAAFNRDRMMLTALFEAVQKRPDLIGNYVAGVLLQAAAALEETA